MNKSSNNKKYKDYCVGCGLCKSEFNCPKYEEKGFIYYDISNVDSEFLKNICPYSGNSQKYVDNNIWGDFHEMYYGWSKDDKIRYEASSGGILTTMAIFLIEKKYVDGVIQVKASEENPISTEVVCSTSKSDVLKCMGSRYSNSSVLSCLNKIVEKDKKYALIGRPCDILTIKNYQQYYKKYENIIYTMSFFCAGNPSDKANEKLINDMGIKNIEKCVKMNYRGNGWPGYAIAKDNKGKEYKMRYAESWGNYLGRDIRLMCKFCIDGCGAAADISCGDHWLLNSNNKPIFDENNGRNLIFARTEKGNQLLLDALKENYIDIFQYDYNNDKVEYVQPAQFQRTTTVYEKCKAFKLFHRQIPNYKLKKLKQLSKSNSSKNRNRIFLGTIKRIIKKKM